MAEIVREQTPLPFENVVTVKGTIVKKETHGLYVQYPYAVEYKHEGQTKQETIVIPPEGAPIEDLLGGSVEIDIANRESAVGFHPAVIRMYHNGKAFYDLFPGVGYTSKPAGNSE